MNINHHKALVEGLKLARDVIARWKSSDPPQHLGGDLAGAIATLDNWVASLPVEGRYGRPGRRADNETPTDVLYGKAAHLGKPPGHDPTGSPLTKADEPQQITRAKLRTFDVFVPLAGYNVYRVEAKDADEALKLWEDNPGNFGFPRYIDREAVTAEPVDLL